MKYLSLVLFSLIAILPVSGFAQLNPSVQQQLSVPKNQIKNGGFESGTAGWAAYLNTAQTTPVTGTGGSPTVTVTASTSSPLQDKSSGLFTKPASNVQGQGYSYAFAIDSALKGRVLSIQGNYQITSGTYSGGTSSTDSDLEVYIYDVDGSQLIQPASYKLDGGVAGLNYQINATFQTNTTSTNYRLIFHHATTSTSAFVVKVDSLSVSAFPKTNGVPVTDWKAYTPTVTGFGTISGSNFYSRRVGDSLEVQGYFTTGTSTAVNATITLGYNGVNASVTADSTKISGGIIGSAIVTGSSTTFFGASVLAGVGNNYVNMGAQTSTTGATTATTGTALSTSSGQLIEVSFKVPIVGWSSNVTTSDSAATNVVAAAINTNSTTSLAASTATQISFTTTAFDTTGSWNGSNTYKCPVPGYYRFTASLELNNQNIGTANEVYINVYKNGSSYAQIGSVYGGGVSQYLQVVGATTLLCNAGDTLSLYATASTATTLISGSNGFLNIDRISGPSQIAASESVNASYSNTSGQSIPSNSATAITGWTRQNDDHVMCTSAGVCTFPISGTYIACLGIEFATAVYAVGNEVTGIVAQAGSVSRSVRMGDWFAQTTSSVPASTTGCQTFHGNAGDTLTFDAFQTSSSSKTLITTDQSFVNFSVQRVGN